MMAPEDIVSAAAVVAAVLVFVWAVLRARTSPLNGSYGLHGCSLAPLSPAPWTMQI